MGTILDIVNKITPRVQDRVGENKSLLQIINEELEKEKSHSHTKQSNENDCNEITFKDILPLGTDLNNIKYNKLSNKTSYRRKYEE